MLNGTGVTTDIHFEVGQTHYSKYHMAQTWMSILVFFMVNCWKALKQTAFQIFDQTHYHRKAFFAYLKIVFKVVIEYLLGIPAVFLAHYQHGIYLQKLGFGDAKTLSDNGSLVWRPLGSAGNETNAGPAQCVTGLIGNASGNPAKCSHFLVEAVEDLGQNAADRS